jgi:hypothetical protein
MPHNRHTGVSALTSPSSARFQVRTADQAGHLSTKPAMAVPHRCQHARRLQARAPPAVQLLKVAGQDLSRHRCPTSPRSTSEAIRAWPTTTARPDSSDHNGGLGKDNPKKGGLGGGSPQNKAVHTAAAGVVPHQNTKTANCQRDHPGRHRAPKATERPATRVCPWIRVWVWPPACLELSVDNPPGRLPAKRVRFNRGAPNRQYTITALVTSSRLNNCCTADPHHSNERLGFSMMNHIPARRAASAT